MSPQQLQGTQVAGSTINECRLVRRRECASKTCGSKPIVAIHSSRTEHIAGSS
jgi:hypothetical protein